MLQGLHALSLGVLNGGEDSLDLVFNLSDLLSIFNLVEDVNHLLKLLAVSSGESADLLEEGQSDLVVLLNEHFVLTFRVLLLWPNSVVSLPSIILFVGIVSRSESLHSEGVRIQFLLWLLSTALSGLCNYVEEGLEVFLDVVKSICNY